MVLVDGGHRLRRQVGEHAGVDAQWQGHEAVEVRAAHVETALPAVLSEHRGSWTLEVGALWSLREVQ